MENMELEIRWCGKWATMLEVMCDMNVQKVIEILS